MLSPRLIVLQPTPYCNIDCAYCYLGSRDRKVVMGLDIVSAVARVLLPLAVDAAVVVWHGGEPTTAPLAWYEEAYRRLAPAAARGLGFAMQTNAVAVDGKWVALFGRTRTSIGVSLDGPRRFHDARRVTRAGQGTFELAMRGFRRLQDAGLAPSVITVLSPRALAAPDEFFEFYREISADVVSFSIDEREGAHARSGFEGADAKPAMTAFLLRLLERAYTEGFPLKIKEVERVAQALAFGGAAANDQNEPWAIVTVDHRGKVGTFSPELTETPSADFAHFRFADILSDPPDSWPRSQAFRRFAARVSDGVEACRASCAYFGACGGGSPVNKLCELGDVGATETLFCRLGVQAAADALRAFIARRAEAGRAASATAVA
jgi:uncharacterized protein